MSPGSDEILAEYRKFQDSRIIPAYKTLYIGIGAFAFFTVIALSVQSGVVASVGVIALIVSLLFPSQNPENNEHYLRLQSMISTGQHHLIDLILSGELTGDEIEEIMFFAGRGNARKLGDNIHWIAFVAELKEHKDKLPDSVVDLLDRLEETHGW